METTKMARAALLSLAIALVFLLAWESFWRSKGFIPTYNDDKALWAMKRTEIYQPSGSATVFIGSSRIKFNLDIPTWEKITGEKAVQLALVGTSPILTLQDLADDEKFAGKLVVDVTEPLFFSQNPAFHQSAKESVAYYHQQTPAEKVSTAIGLALESQLAFLEERRFSLNTLLNDIPLPNRPGVFQFPAFPKTFEWNTLNRQTYMSDMFLADSAALKRQTDIWAMLIMGNPEPPIAGKELDEVLAGIKTSVDKIRSRGGRVIFVRTPSSGPMEAGEQQAFPLEQYWSRLLDATDTPGIHYKDHPETAHYICPEWSHLSPTDAVDYTHHLVKQLGEKGWFALNKSDLVNP
ncbi:MAG: hypothetical protein KDD10_22070 [Phaeodactylibacter sp.]|nr:hypothetical protein [Phaeodactylibacter sp.]MCB9293607.1 hypothetical protein [Lewinellaceae bacterium]